MKINYCLVCLILYKLSCNEVSANLSVCERSTDKGNVSDCLIESEEPSIILPLVKLGQKSYYFSSDLMASWHGALKFCTLHKLKLVKIKSESENQLIIRYIKGFVPGSFYWIGATDLGDEGKFYWMEDGEAVTLDDWNVKPWSPNQPDNAGGEENCVEIWMNDYKWNDNVCHTYKKFICEL